MLTFHHDMTSGLQYLLPFESDELLCIITLTVHFQLTIFKISIQTNHTHVLQNMKQSGRNLLIIWNDVWTISGTLLAHKILAQKSELVKYLKTTFSPHVRRLPVHAHNLRYQNHDHF